MKILFIQLSDMHLEKKEELKKIELDKVIQALNIVGECDECIIILNGDLTKAGRINEYKLIKALVGRLIYKLKEGGFRNKKIHVLPVPGNHDLDLTNNIRTFDEIVKGYKANEINELLKKEIKSLDDFFEFANYNKCFMSNKMFCYKIIEFREICINFLLLNTAPFSLKGSTNEDKGIHYFKEEEMKSLIPDNPNNLNVVIMHHNTEWFNNKVKEQLDEIFKNNYSLVFTGHEHSLKSESKYFENEKNIYSLQAPSLLGDKTHEAGFITGVYDTTDRKLEAYSFMWKDTYYEHKKIYDVCLPIKKTRQLMTPNTKFLNYIQHDDNQKLINEYFICPTLSYNITNDKNDIESNNIEEIERLIQLISENQQIIIAGEANYGKTTLAKVIYEYVLQNHQDKVPLLLTNDDLSHKRIDRIVRYAFDEQYEDPQINYIKYEQLSKKNKLVIIDDADKIDKNVLEKLIRYFEDIFESIVIFSEDKIDLNMQKKVEDVLVDKKIIHINIRPFLYQKRKMLIEKLYDSIHTNSNLEKRTREISEINKVIHNQVRFFRLDPEFIVNFVIQYTDKVNISNNGNIFNLVYENNIRTRLIEQISEDEIAGIFNVLQEMAFFMHFNRLSSITFDNLIKVIEDYNKEYRQNVVFLKLLEAGSKASILVHDNRKVRFKDRNLLAYFVAQALNRKFNNGEEEDKFSYLLDNLCFSINSDIVLFMAFITSNQRIIQVIMDCAKNHFKDKSEFSFEEKNIKILCESDFKVKNTLPNKNEKNLREKELIRHEEEIKNDQVIELIDEYNYTEEEINNFENQMLKSIKYIEIISKILPAFSHNMKAKQQEELVKAIYAYPNIFIYEMLKDLDENYEKKVVNLYSKVNEIRKQKNLSELNIEYIEKTYKQYSISLVISLYEVVACTCTTKQTINILNDLEFINKESNKILNLMISEKNGNIKEFYNKAIKLNQESDLKIIKSLVKYTVREFFLDNEVKLVGEAQSLIDKFFGTSNNLNRDKNKLRLEIVKNKIYNM